MYVLNLNIVSHLILGTKKQLDIYTIGFLIILG